jgi:hypothetical protein
MIAYDKNEVANRCEALSEIWWQGRQWSVTAAGLECRDGTYFIDKKRLLEDHGCGWVAHVGRKTWVDVDDFATFYLAAVAMHGFRLTRAKRAAVLKAHAKAIVSHEIDELHREMFPSKSAFEAIDLVELDRRCDLVNTEYRRRRDAKTPLNTTQTTSTVSLDGSSPKP